MEECATLKYSSKFMCNNPFNLSSVASAAIAAAVSNEPKISEDSSFSRNLSNPNLLIEDSFQANVQQSVHSNRPSAPPLPSVTQSIHHHHVLYKAVSSGYVLCFRNTLLAEYFSLIIHENKS